ncbi:hypothetical protein KCU64_g26, partial [Aureobasidium melanogenum]
LFDTQAVFSVTVRSQETWVGNVRAWHCLRLSVSSELHLFVFFHRLTPAHHHLNQRKLRTNSSRHALQRTRAACLSSSQLRRVTPRLLQALKSLVS